METRRLEDLKKIPPEEMTGNQMWAYYRSTKDKDARLRYLVARAKRRSAQRSARDRRNYHNKKKKQEMLEIGIKLLQEEGHY